MLMESKKPIKHDAKKDYARNPSICACECDKNCDINEYLKKLHLGKQYKW